MRYEEPRKMGLMSPYAGQQGERRRREQPCRPWGKERGGEPGAASKRHIALCNTASGAGAVCCGAQPELRYELEGGWGVGDAEAAQEGGTCASLREIRVDVWQKPTPHDKAIILQLKITS